MGRKKNIERELRWRELVDRQASSGLSVRAFCSELGISQPSFYAWRKRLRGRESADRRGDRPSVKKEAEGGSKFIPVRLLESVSSLVVVHPLGYQVRVTGDVNLTVLRQVLDVLDGRRAG